MNTLFFRLLAAGLTLAFSCGLLPAAENEVVIVSPHADGIKEETSRAFNAWHQKTYGQPAVIRWRDVGGGGSQIVRFLNSEYKAGPSAGVDILYGGGVDPFLSLQKDKLLTPYDPPADELAQIPATYNGLNLIDPGHEWFATALSGFGILVNERARQAAGLPVVHSWSDLADPRLCNWISACDPRASSSALQIYEIILQAYGWDKGWRTLMAISANTRHFLPSAAASAVEVGMGDAAYGVAIDSYGQAQASFYGPENVSFLLPEGLTVISPDSVAILKNPPHPTMAQRFIDFVLSRDNQLLWMLPKGAPGGATHYVVNRMSIWPALYTELKGVTPVRNNPFALKNRFPYSNALGSKRRGILTMMIGAWMIDAHDGLVRAWRALHSPKAGKLSPERRTELETELLAPPCTQDELLKLVETDWPDPVKRTALINRWQSEADARYKKLLAEVNAG